MEEVPSLPPPDASSLPGQQPPRPPRRLSTRVSRPFQLYDERGHPINPRSREFARAMRRAQNDVLSVVGVCVRDIPKPETARYAPRFEPDPKLLDLVDTESIYGLAIRAFSLLTQHMGTWWLGSLSERLLVCMIIWMALIAG